MRRTVLISLLALATAALSGPAVASADVTFVKSGNLLKAGTPIAGEGIGHTEVQGDYLTCGPFEFSGELTKNNPAKVKMSPIAVVFCKAGGGPWWVELSNFKMTPIEFFAGNAVSYYLDFEVRYIYNMGQVCSKQKLSTGPHSGTWSSNAKVDFSIPITNSCLGSGVINGYFEMTSKGSPFEIVVK